MSEEKSSESSPFGCIGCVLTILMLWALLFGVTWGGLHYQIRCTNERGVEFVAEPKP